MSLVLDDVDLHDEQIHVTMHRSRSMGQGRMQDRGCDFLRTVSDPARSWLQSKPPLRSEKGVHGLLPFPSRGLIVIADGLGRPKPIVQLLLIWDELGRT